jgi:hypothetical protein
MEICVASYRIITVWWFSSKKFSGKIIGFYGSVCKYFIG